MASTVWKGQLTFGMVSIPVRLIKAARKERIALKYVKEAHQQPPAAPALTYPATSSQDEENRNDPSPAFHQDHDAASSAATAPFQREIIRVRQGYFSEDQTEPSPARDLQRGYEVAPDNFVVIRQEEIRSLRKATSVDMQILRSVRMQEIDPVFLETSYYVVPGTSGESSYSLFYRALSETQLAALAHIVMHGREHVMVIRAGARGLIAHTMFYLNEVRGSEEFRTDTAAVADKELDLAKKYIMALEEPFRPEEFTDSYLDGLQALISSKESTQPAGAVVGKTKDDASGGTKVIDIMEALRKSLELTQKSKIERKPASAEASSEGKQSRRKSSN